MERTKKLRLIRLTTKKINMNKSITQRWLMNSLGIISVILILLVIAFSFVIKNFYYSSVKQILTSEANVISSIVEKTSNSDNTNPSIEIRNAVENFADKEKMELMAIDHKGEITLTSSGFSYWYKTNIPDYEKAKYASNGMGQFIGKLDSGEKVMAITTLIPIKSSEYSALRFVVSLKTIDRMIFMGGLVFVVVCVAILLFVAISGGYFIKSIVIPVGQISVAAKKIASGKYDTRIKKDSDDELGQLCDTINHMAEELAVSENVKNEFISSVSHELRTPLTAIKGWGETLESVGVQDSEILKKGVHVILNETERLSEMVEELLDFSRMQDGRFTLFKTKMDILAELGEAVLIYAERAKKENIELIYNEPLMLSPIFGDKNRLKQVFINVIDNAIKYSDGGGRVTIQAIEDKDHIEITVSDTGCGISAQDLPHVKEKFYKANITRRGSGIGLAVATEIIALHDGELCIESELNVGTRVIIKLPILVANEEKTTESGIEERSDNIVEE
ncbi:MAG: Two-component system sensor histidine kinase [Oscillospiraceae bacterium]|jgi:signal transduction histidine kinase|nr:Two-component system sensor histidine kinase [Oscillospiraceae bacterium]